MCKSYNMLSWVFFVVPSLVMFSGCGNIPDSSEETDDQEDAEMVGEVQQPSGNTWDVGIIPTTTSCPNGGPLREIYMDDEDKNNANKIVGWVGATLQSPQGTSFRFCRVDGSFLFPLASASAVNTDAFYAVLKMGSQCPNGSFEFSRYFDNEDKKNKNSNSGDIEPSSQSKQGTKLVFCLFKYATPGGATMSAFPSYGIPYGVFANYDTSFPLALSKGYVNTDDEDSGNANAYYASPDWVYDAQAIVTGGPNTTLEMARVK